MSIVVSVVALSENVCLIVCDRLLKFMSSAPSDSDGDLPLAIQNFRRDSLHIGLTSPD